MTSIKNFGKLLKKSVAIAASLLLLACSTNPEPQGDVVWETTDKEVLIKGCEDWKKRNPEADC